MTSPNTEDEDLKAAIELSLAENQEEQVSLPSAADVTTESLGASGDPSTNGSVSLPSTATSFAGLDRKAMEAERLARLARKRERSISPPPLSSRKAPKLENTTVSLPSGARLTSFSTVVNQDQRGRKSEIANAANQQMKQPHSGSAIKDEPVDEHLIKTELSSQGSLKYPNGVVKRTWAFGFERTSNDVKLEEVLEPLTLRTAVLSAFQWDADWVLAKLKTPANGGSTKCVFIMQAETDELRQKLLRESEGMRSFLRLCFPPMYAPIHCMHSKLMLLFHSETLRIAVPTANLLNFDWGETGVMENSVFMIDLPRLPNSTKIEMDELTPFGKELLYFLKRQGVDKDVRNGILNFDFSATQDIMFIHTTGGTHYDEDAERTGLLGLARAVRQLKLDCQEDLQIDIAASSIGSLNDDYLRNVHAAARGADMIQRANAASSKAKADFFKPATKSPSESVGIREKVRIYFPTHETVTSSIAGAAGTICLNRKWFESDTFPRTSFRDYRSTRSGLLSHNKILYARGKTEGHDGTKDIAWAYVGSANMSESAWGKLVYDKKEKTWKISCRNWECGVLLPVPQEKLAPRNKAISLKETIKKEKIEGEDSETESEEEQVSVKPDSKNEGTVGIDVFDGVVRPPFEIPGPRYGGQQPWYFLESKR